MDEKKCKYCAMMIPKEAKICPHCRKTQGTSFAVGCLAVILVLIVMGIAITSFKDSSTSPTTSTSSVSVGKEGRLDSGAPETPVAVTEAAFDAWTSAAVAKDKHGMASLLVSGKVFGVKQGTKALVIDNAMFKRKIRVLEGKYKGASGWIAMEHIK